MTVLFVIATVLLFLTVDWLIQRSRENRAVVAEIAPVSARELSVRIPDGIFFAPSHTWLNLFPSGKVRLGVDDFISRLLEKPGVTLLRSAGDKISKGDPILNLKSDGHSLTVRAPIDCEIVSVNDSLAKNPGLLEEGLFSDGWAYMIRPARNADLKDLLLGNESRQWIRTEYQRLKDLLAGTGAHGTLRPAFLQEGGPPIAGVLNRMDDAVWQKLDIEFLHVQ
ncbi:MAG TPA: glycine cleavage system protein H [Bacteroidota bacterium]|nr:glycine cleavage system protein H [Bacteroidota bacterium]